MCPEVLDFQKVLQDLEADILHAHKNSSKLTQRPFTDLNEDHLTNSGQVLMFSKQQQAFEMVL